MIRATSILVFTLLAGPVLAASPTVSRLAPLGVQRGTEAIVAFQGARLADAKEVLISTPGLAVKKLEVVSDTQVKATLTIAPDCRLGEHPLRLRTASGISEARMLWVGALPTIDEIEPNSEFATPQPMALNTTVHGSIGNEDVDYFVVECKKGQRLSVEVEGMRLGVGFWDPYVAIMNDKRFELVTSDDSPMSGQDGGCSTIIPADGKYIVMIRESAYGAGAGYRLHIGNFPRPTAVIPAGGRPGEEIEFRFIGDPAGEIKQKIKLPATADRHFRLHAQTTEGIAPTGFKCGIIEGSNAIETPADLDPKSAQVVAFPGAYNGIIGKAGEVKFFKFTAKKGQVFDINCRARQYGSALDPVMSVNLWVNNAVAGAVAANDDSGGPDSFVRFTAPQDGDYVVQVFDHLRKGGPDYFFRVEATPIVAFTTTSIPRVDGNNPTNQDRQNITVPQGGRYATMVNISRNFWSGAAILNFPGLPVGITPMHDAIEPGTTALPVVFEAKANAPAVGAWVPFNASPADPKVVAAPQTALDVFFNPGPNNQPFHRYTLDRIAVTVAEPAPYSIEVIEPKVALPQNGSMNLKIVAKRLPGFTRPITVFPLFSPSGVGFQGSATIPENGTEVTLSMNAAPNAPARKWKTAIVAVGDAGKGPVYTSSQLFALEVSPPIVALAQERTAVEQGQATQVFGKLAVNTPFPGEATVTLIGLPAKAVAPEVKITKDTKEITFPVSTDKSTPAGKHGTFCRVQFNWNGEVVTQSIGGGELRVDVPLPPKVAVTPMPMPTTTPMPQPKPVPPPMTPPKRLTRLEQLRLEQEEREKAAKAGTPAPPKKEEPKK